MSTTTPTLTPEGSDGSSERLLTSESKECYICRDSENDEVLNYTKSPPCRCKAPIHDECVWDIVQGNKERGKVEYWKCYTCQTKFYDGRCVICGGVEGELASYCDCVYNRFLGHEHKILYHQDCIIKRVQQLRSNGVNNSEKCRICKKIYSSGIEKNCNCRLFCQDCGLCCFNACKIMIATILIAIYTLMTLLFIYGTFLSWINEDWWRISVFYIGAPVILAVIVGFSTKPYIIEHENINCTYFGFYWPTIGIWRALDERGVIDVYSARREGYGWLITNPRHKTRRVIIIFLTTLIFIALIHLSGSGWLFLGRRLWDEPIEYSEIIQNFGLPTFTAGFVTLILFYSCALVKISIQYCWRKGKERWIEETPVTVLPVTVLDNEIRE